MVTTTKHGLPVTGGVWVRINGIVFEAPTPEGVRDEVRKWIDEHGYGMSDVGGLWPMHNHAVVKKLSYNGRLWKNAKEEWTR